MGDRADQKNVLFRAQAAALAIRALNKSGAKPQDDSSHTDAIPNDDEQRTDDAAGLPTMTPITALISWAHKNPGWSTEQANQWRDSVLQFAAGLRNPGGIDADLDLYHSADLEVDWTRFGPSAIANSDFILIIMSFAWRDRWAGDNDPKVGAGAVGEADKLKGEFVTDQAKFQRRAKIIMLPGVPDDAIPTDLHRLNRYYVDPDDFETYEDLLRALSDQPEFAKPPISSVPTLPSAITRMTGHTSTHQPRKNSQLENLSTEIRVTRRRLEQLVRADRNASHFEEIRSTKEKLAVLESLADSAYSSGDN